MASDSTCWTTIRAAAAGSQSGREDFARQYEPVVRAYLVARWRGAALIADIDDALQETFVELVRPAGAIEKADEGQAGGFRAFLYGVTRNVAKRFESRAVQSKHAADLSTVDAIPGPSEEQCSRAFDRAWAQRIMREAGEAQSRAATTPEAKLRIKLLRLRFAGGMPIREIAPKLGLSPEHAHREYAKARDEFAASLREIVRFYDPDGGTLDRDCAQLLAMLA